MYHIAIEYLCLLYFNFHKGRNYVLGISDFQTELKFSNFKLVLKKI